MSTFWTAMAVFAVALLGGVMQTVAGFGYVIIFMAVVPMLLPVGQCLVAAQAGGVVMALWMLMGKFKKLELGYVLWPALFASLSSMLGLAFLKTVSGAAYMRGLGLLLVLLALWMWKLSGRVHIRPSPLSGGICGAVGGLMGSVFGVSVPPLVLYFSSNMSDKDSYTVPLQFTLAVQTAVCLAGRAAFGMWPENAWPFILAAVCGAVLGKFPGRLIYGRLDVEMLKRLIYIFIALLGVYTFIKG